MQPVQPPHDGEVGHNIRRRIAEPITLPPIQTSPRGNLKQPIYKLPPISSLDNMCGAEPSNSTEVLRRLRLDDESLRVNYEEPRARSRSVSVILK